MLTLPDIPMPAVWVIAYANALSLFRKKRDVFASIRSSQYRIRYARNLLMGYNPVNKLHQLITDELIYRFYDRYNEDGDCHNNNDNHLQDEHDP